MCNTAQMKEVLECYRNLLSFCHKKHARNSRSLIVNHATIVMFSGQAAIRAPSQNQVGFILLSHYDFMEDHTLLEMSVLELLPCPAFIRMSVSNEKENMLVLKLDKVGLKEM